MCPSPEALWVGVGVEVMVVMVVVTVVRGCLGIVVGHQKHG